MIQKIIVCDGSIASDRLAEVSFSRNTAENNNGRSRTIDGSKIRSNRMIRIMIRIISDKSNIICPREIGNSKRIIVFEMLGTHSQLYGS